MATNDTNSNEKSIYIIAKEIEEILRGRESNQQERILRWVSENLELAFPGQPPAQPAQSGQTQSHQVESASTRPMDIRTFYAEKQPKSDVHFVAFVAFYYRFVAPEPARKDFIISEDLQNAARGASRERFKKPSVTLNNAVLQGYMDRVVPGEFRLNAVGENLVAMTLPGTGGEKSSIRKPRKLRANSTSAKKAATKK